MKRSETPFFNRNLAAAVAVAALTMGTTAALKAFNPQPDPPAFGLIYLLPSQEARLNATCYAGTPRFVSPGPCRVGLVFADTAGNVLARTAQSLNPGQSTSFELPAAQTPLGREGRIGIVPTVLTDGVGAVVASFEAVDMASGKTEIFTNAAVPRAGMLVPPAE